jgi:hypothetical protein
VHFRLAARQDIHPVHDLDLVADCFCVIMEGLYSGMCGAGWNQDLTFKYFPEPSKIIPAPLMGIYNFPIINGYVPANGTFLLHQGYPTRYC